MWPLTSAPRMRPGAIVRLRLRLGEKRYGQPHSHQLHPCQIVDSKVTKVQHQLPHQCHQGLRDWEVPGIHTMADGPAENPKAI